jgi:hypothetical protein
LVTVEKKAQQRIYRVNVDSMLELEGWIKQLTKHWNARFDALEKVLEEEKKKNK